jgi:pilus assembly protein Flp/PilA
MQDAKTVWQATRFSPPLDSIWPRARTNRDIYSLTPHMPGQPKTIGRQAFKPSPEAALRFTHLETEEVVMRSINHSLLTFLKEDDGPTAVEYAVMLALIIVVCLTSIIALGTNANNTFSYVGPKLGKVGS